MLKLRACYLLKPNALTLHAFTRIPGAKPSVSSSFSSCAYEPPCFARVGVVGAQLPTLLLIVYLGRYVTLPLRVLPEVWRKPSTDNERSYLASYRRLDVPNREDKRGSHQQRERRGGGENYVPSINIL